MPSAPAHSTEASSPGAGARRDRRPLLALLTADLISQTGNEFTGLAIPLFVLATTGSASRTGLTAVAAAVATVVAGVLGGALVDRLGHKRTAVLADLASAGAVALIPLLNDTIGLAFGGLLGLVFLGAVLDTPGWAARRSLVERAARRGDVGLERANTWSQMAGRAAGLVGPLLAGLLIAATDATLVLWFDAASFLLSAAIVAGFVPGEPRPGVAAAQPVITSVRAQIGSYLTEAADGFRFIWGEPVVLGLMLGFGLGQMLAEPIYALVLPVYAREVLDGAADLGVLYAALAAGSIAGNVLYLLLAPRLPRRGTIVAGFAVRALTFWILVPLPPVWIVASSIVVNAVSLEPTNPIAMSIFQERIPDAIRGRVFSTFLAFSYAARSVGLLAYGLLLDGAGLQTTLVLLAAANLLVPATLWLIPALRNLNRPGLPDRRVGDGEAALG